MKRLHLPATLRVGLALGAPRVCFQTHTHNVRWRVGPRPMAPRPARHRLHEALPLLTLRLGFSWALSRLEIDSKRQCQEMQYAQTSVEDDDSKQGETTQGMKAPRRARCAPNLACTEAIGLLAGLGTTLSFVPQAMAIIATGETSVCIHRIRTRAPRPLLALIHHV